MDVFADKSNTLLTFDGLNDLYGALGHAWGALGANFWTVCPIFNFRNAVESLWLAEQFGAI